MKKAEPLYSGTSVKIDRLLRYLQQKKMAVTDLELKILYCTNTFPYGVSMGKLSEELKMNRGNLSRYVRGLISRGILKEINKNPRLVTIGNPRYMCKTNLVKCPNCDTVSFVSADYKIFKCKECKKDMHINTDMILNTISNDDRDKLTALCRMHDCKSYSELINKLFKEKTKK